MRIERHVFGSYKGYTTLAKSLGISAEDGRDLEGGVYGFGQTEDSRYAKSLQSRAAYFTRVLKGNRRGLTRVLAGEPDSDGRPTNLMITAVLSCSDWDAHLLGAVSQLLADKQIWQWTTGQEIAALDRTYLSPPATITRKSVLKVAALLSEIERRWNAPSSIIVSEAEIGGEEMRAVEMLIPPRNRPRFTSACRSLGGQLAVTLNQLAAEAPHQKVNFHFDPRAPVSAYGEFLLDNGLADGELPIREVMTYRSFAIPERSNPAARRMYVPPPMPMGKPKRRWIIRAGAAILLVLIVGGGYCIQKGKFAKNAALLPSRLEAPAAISATSRDVPTSNEISAARSALDSPAPVFPPPSAASRKIVTAPVQARAAPVAVSTPEESEQEKELTRLQSHWESFIHQINGKALTFIGPKGDALDSLELEMHRDGLVKRVEMGATGNIAALPILLEIRNEYFQVNSLLSDPYTTNPEGLVRAEQRLEACTVQAKRILNPITNERSRNARMFINVDRAIQNARQQLKNIKAGGGR